jgi:DNA-binding transcriptional regulator YiaG
MTPAQIRTLRKRLKMSASQFARALGFVGKNSHITVYRWETGERAPSRQTIILMRMLREA